MTLTLTDDRTDPARPAAGGVAGPGAGLPARLTAEWARICADPAAAAAVAGWGDPELAGLAGPGGVLELVRNRDTGLRVRDAVLCALLRRAQAGDALAGRIVLQVMLPKAVLIGNGLSVRLGNDRAEAFALIFAALWRTIMTYPLARRPERVTGNLAMDTLTLVRGRGVQRRQGSELPLGDLGTEDGLRAVAHARQNPRATLGLDWSVAFDGDAPAGVELLALLSWAVRHDVLTAGQAALLGRVYGLGGGPEAGGPALAAELGLSWPALRQRCHRLTATLRRAALAHGLTGVGDRQARIA